MSTIPKPFEVYRHFKGNYYQVINIATHSETGEQMVIYQQLYSPFQMYVRPLDMFMSKVDHEKYPQVEQEYRFALQTSLPHAQNEGLYPEFRKTKVDDAKKDVPATNEDKTVSSVKKDIVVRENRNMQTADAKQSVKMEEQSEKRSLDMEDSSYSKKDSYTIEEMIEQPDENRYDEHHVTEEEASLPPMLLKFLDADSYEEKLQILSNMHKEITDSMINTMAVSLDLEVKEGDIEDRYREVMNCLVTMEKFECNRLR